MKLTFDFSKFIRKLDYVKTIIEDKFLHENMSNFIFCVNKDSVSVIGYNVNSLCNTVFDSEDLVIDNSEEEVQYLQLKGTVLTKFLDSFKNLKKTKPTVVELEPTGVQVALRVTEEYTDGSGTDMVNEMLFDNIPLRADVKQSIDMSTSNGVQLEQLDIPTLQMYIDNLMPVLKNESNTLHSRMHFATDKVICMHPIFTTVYENVLPSAFKGIVFTYSALTFLKKLISIEENVLVGKGDKSIVFKTKDSEAFLRYTSVIPEYSRYVNGFKKDIGVSFDRVFFKETLKRLAIGGSDVTVTIDKSIGKVVLSNGKYEHALNILAEKGIDTVNEGNRVRFKTRLELLDNAVIGDDKVFADADVFIYLIPVSQKKYTIYFADSTGMWFSIASVIAS